MKTVPTYTHRNASSFVCWIFRLLLLACLRTATVLSRELSVDDLLSLGDDALSQGATEKAVDYYKSGLDILSEDDSLITALSLETNLASALSSVGLDKEATGHYQKAVSIYSTEIDDIVDKATIEFAKEITAQASFYLGMVLQDLGEPRKSVEAYGYTVVLDPYHWASLANLGSVLHDQLRLHDEALEAYNKAYEILTQTEVEPTDAPENASSVLSQLQYRIGLCLSHDVNRKCTIYDDPDKPVSCTEMATHAFALAVKFDPDNESAKHMLATITADATLTRASNDYVKSLFDEYAHK
jgi:tetratricopeptide (TPR) repeat protein